MSQESDVAEILFQFEGLTISVKRNSDSTQLSSPPRSTGLGSGFGHSPQGASLARSSGPARSDSSWTVPSGSDPGPEGERAEPWSSQWRAELVGACTPEQLLDLDLSPLESWVPRLSACGEWSPLARLGRGLRAGVAARIRLSGESTAVCESPRLAVQNRIYVVLRAAPRHASGWTTSYSIYVSKVRGSAGERFHRDSVSHAFASRAEASAYVLGAGCSWPPEYQASV